MRGKKNEGVRYPGRRVREGRDEEKEERGVRDPRKTHMIGRTNSVEAAETSPSLLVDQKNWQPTNRYDTLVCRTQLVGTRSVAKKEERRSIKSGGI